MTDTLHELPAKWREKAARYTKRKSPLNALRLTECADELEAALRAEPTEAEVERVAEALWSRLNGGERIRHLPTWRAHARAAIKALREG